MIQLNKKELSVVETSPTKRQKKPTQMSEL